MFLGDFLTCGIIGFSKKDGFFLSRQTTLLRMTELLFFKGWKILTISKSGHPVNGISSTSNIFSLFLVKRKFGIKNESSAFENIFHPKQPNDEQISFDDERLERKMKGPSQTDTRKPGEECFELWQLMWQDPWEKNIRKNLLWILSVKFVDLQFFTCFLITIFFLSLLWSKILLPNIIEPDFFVSIHKYQVRCF